jgi:hypothetical protein
MYIIFYIFQHLRKRLFCLQNDLYLSQQLTKRVLPKQNTRTEICRVVSCPGNISL